jgi:CheY-like chemotaxis protein
MKNFKRILLVEDDPNDIELTLNTLEKYNLANETVVARDGIEALDYLYYRDIYANRMKGNPVVILLDLKMPKMDGIKLLQHLNKDDEIKKIPVVILTSSRENRDLEECYKLGINAYVVKPVVFEDFVEAVREIGIFWALINELPSGNIE